MNILKIIHGYPPHYNAGSEVYTKNLVNELKKKNRIILFSRYENEYELDFAVKCTEHKNLKHIQVNMPRKKESYSHKEIDQFIKSLISVEKIDIAHIGHLHHLSTGIIDVLHKKNIPILFTLHDFWLMCPRGQFLQRNSDGNSYYKLCSKQEDSKCAKNCFSIYHHNKEYEIEYWEKWVQQRMEKMHEINKKVSLFIAPSEYLRKRFIKDFSVEPKKIKYLEYGFKLPSQKEKYPKKDTFSFGYLGTHIPSKGVNLLVEAFHESKLDAHLQIFGPITPSDRHLTRSNRIHFLGDYLNENIYKNILSKIDCLVIPSIWTENSPLVFSEAKIWGIPVLTADAGGMLELAKKHENCFTFKHRSKEDLKKKLKFIFKNRKSLEYSTTNKIQTIENHTKEIFSIYQELLNQ
jgi:glycosyltransferase involved in cell wall biosynthesis